MHLYSTPLPNEILRSITEYIAYIPELPDSCCSYSLSKHASPELLALSVVSSRLRQICLPLLFTHIEVRHDEDVNKLEKRLALYAKYTKTLSIDYNKETYYTLTEVGQQVLCQILPQLERLVDVGLGRCQNRTHLLESILTHPSVTSVLIHDLPDVSMCNHNLSKVILTRAYSSSALSPIYQTYFDQGMKLMCLGLKSDSVDNRLESQLFPGLKAIEIDMYSAPFSFSWLSPLASTHPGLVELRLLKIDHRYLAHNVPPFLLPLFEESQRQDFEDDLEITRLTLRRAQPIGQSSREWHVFELDLHIHDRMCQILSLVGSCFPSLEVLALDFENYVDGMFASYLSSELVDFLSLRVVYLKDIYHPLRIDEGIEMPPIVQLDPLDEMRAFAESTLLALAAHLVKEVRTLDSVHIDDSGDEYDEDGNAFDIWYIRKWIHALNSNCDVSGISGREPPPRILPDSNDETSTDDESGSNNDNSSSDGNNS
ncbi:hypothetical protein F5878DRAFT_634111 [Lentinula raphanica]|uniref:F-box domain-containing protein n=1 Tax=Lentinula raphanica TaxID=153919 RepID=A0AA38U5Q3_9AGAR|nr:hypothetical protein F5878DRAFT_634111 [Lentinula raphanica]